MEKTIVYILTVLLNMVSNPAVSFPSLGDAQSGPYNRSLYWDEPVSSAVIAWKIYTSGRALRATAKYANTVWREEGRRPSVHCDLIDACGIAVYVFIVPVTVSEGGEGFVVAEGEIIRILWSPF